MKGKELDIRISSCSGADKISLDHYFKFLIKKYNLESIYKSFLIFLNLFIFTRESFFWIVILTQQNELKDKAKMLKIICGLFMILIVATVFENIYLKYKITLLNKLNEYHLQYNFDLITKCKGSEVLSMNLIEQFMYIESVKGGLDNIIQEKQLLTNIIVTSITVLLASRKINIFLVSGLLVGFNSGLYLLQRKNMLKEQTLNEENTENINKIRNYFVDSKQKIINKNFNTSYCLDLFKKYFGNNLQLVKIENNVNTYNSIIVFVTTLIIVLVKYRTSTILDIFVYLLIIYDLDYFVDNLFSLYKIKKSYVKTNLHLKLLLDKTVIEDEINKKDSLNNLQLFKLTKTEPSLMLGRPLNLSKGDFILCNGKSGEGKTTFLKLLKSIEFPDEISLKINGEFFEDSEALKPYSNKIFLTIQNNKLLYDENLYQFVSNHSSNPNIQRIKDLLECVCINHLFDGSTNKVIEVDKLSGGEQMRMTLCQTLYDIIEGDYDIILFDEIDVNLDNNTANKIFTNIFNYFNDKMCLFIVHNDELKKRFNKEILFQNHIMIPNF